MEVDLESVSKIYYFLWVNGFYMMSALIATAYFFYSSTKNGTIASFPIFIFKVLVLIWLTSPVETNSIILPRCIVYCESAGNILKTSLLKKFNKKDANEPFPNICTANMINNSKIFSEATRDELLDFYNKCYTPATALRFEMRKFTVKNVLDSRIYSAGVVSGCIKDLAKIKANIVGETKENIYHATILKRISSIGENPADFQSNYVKFIADKELGTIHSDPNLNLLAKWLKISKTSNEGLAFCLYLAIVILAGVSFIQNNTRYMLYAISFSLMVSLFQIFFYTIDIDSQRLNVLLDGEFFTKYEVMIKLLTANSIWIAVIIIVAIITLCRNADKYIQGV